MPYGCLIGKFGDRAELFFRTMAEQRTISRYAIGLAGVPCLQAGQLQTNMPKALLLGSPGFFWDLMGRASQPY